MNRQFYTKSSPNTMVLSANICVTQIILKNLREDIKGEFEAVILYEQMLAIIPIPDVRYTIYSIINEEKGHAEHLTQLLFKYDTGKYNGLH